MISYWKEEEWIQIITYFIFSHRKDKAKCLTEQSGDNMLTSLTKDPNLFSVSRQCKEWLQDDFNTEAPFREVCILFKFLQNLILVQQKLIDIINVSSH